MHAPRVIVDFPARARNRGRLAFADPRRIIAAHRLEDVRPGILAAEEAARAGAWVAGFVAYEAAPAFDRALVTRPHAGPAPLLWFAVFDEPAHLPSPADAPALPPLSWEVDVTRTEYDTAIHRIREAIAAGDVYQVNHTLRFTADCDRAPASLHDALVAARHGVYHVLIETDDWAVISASPELFIDVHGRIITSRPMKGTARRGRWDREDAAVAARLHGSAKDRAENLMIVDLIRNDLGRVAAFGTVEVRDMFAVETYPTVHQMTSTVSATLRDDVTLDDIFAAVFPCGSVTGAPKVAAMQQIAALEHSPRGPYCGAVGVIRPGGHATFNVAIRTLVIDRRERRAVYGAGGGITWDSSAEAEYDEAIAKAGILSETLPRLALLETMALVDGRIHRRALHLERLTASARFWGFADTAAAAADAALARVERDVPHGCWRVRLTMTRDADIDVTRTPLNEPPAELPPVTADSGADAPARIALAAEPVHSRDPLLHHKTTARDVYEQRRAGAHDVYDVLLRNERDEVTEFTNGNLVCEIDGRLVTPPRDCGLLAGTFRSELLNAGIVEERIVTVDDVRVCTRMWLVNSVRGWVPVGM